MSIATIPLSSSLKDLPALPSLPGLCHLIEGNASVSFEAVVRPQLVCKGVHPLRQISFGRYPEPFDGFLLRFCNTLLQILWRQQEAGISSGFM